LIRHADLQGMARIPTHLEVAGLIRSVNAEGGFATVIAKGERETGSLLVVCCENGRDTRLFERMPSLDGDRVWTLSMAQDPENPQIFSEYLDRRRNQDPDCWIVELDIADAGRFVA
jgi:hypothetical protein